MKALFLALSSAGYGETLIGLSLARQLASINNSVHFVIDTISQPLLQESGFPFTVLDAQMGPLAGVLVNDAITEFGPDVIVLSDYFTYCGVFAKRFNLDP